MTDPKKKATRAVKKVARKVKKLDKKIARKQVKVKKKITAGVKAISKGKDAKATRKFAAVDKQITKRNNAQEKKDLLKDNPVAKKASSNRIAKPVPKGNPKKSSFKDLKTRLEKGRVNKASQVKSKRGPIKKY